MTTPPPDPFNPFTGGLTPSQTELVVGKLDDGTEIAEIMRQFYPLLLERAWEREGQNVEIGLAFDLRNPRVQETISGLATKVKRVADTGATPTRCGACYHALTPRDCRTSRLRDCCAVWRRRRPTAP